ncbi:MAG: hypothetical protein D6750_03515 [Bacteroidetes bacterium]|nr:MAG: hypothetical protein D6750_03515 [Bacteroidota bacterium]
MARLPHPPKFYQALQQAEQRYATGLYIAPGKKLLQEALRSLPEEAFHAILYAEGAVERSWPPTLEAKAFSVPAWQLARIAGLESPEGVVVVLQLPTPVALVPPFPPAVLAEGLQDPGNVGTLLRTMEWFGFSQLWLSEGSVDPYHPRVVRASMGSVFRVRAQKVAHWESLLPAYEGRCVVADLEGEPADTFDWHRYDALYLGSEARGPRQAPQHWPRVRVPSAPTSRADSLNVTIAAAILLYLAAHAKADTRRT